MNTATNDQFVTRGSVFVFPLSSRLCSGPPVLNQIGSAGYYLIKRVDPPFISLALQRGPDTKTEPVRPAEGRTLQLCSSAALLSVSNDVTFETWCRHQSRALSEALSALESEFQIHEPLSVEHLTAGHRPLSTQHGTVCRALCIFTARSRRLNLSQTFIKYIRQTVEHQHA